MYTNHQLMCGSTTAVLDAATMIKDKIDIQKFIKNIDNAVCHYDSDSKKIYMNLSQTKDNSRSSDWVKTYGKYFIYDESREGIEEFHKIKMDPLLKSLLIPSLIDEVTKTSKTIADLKKIDSDLFCTTSYESFIKFSFDSKNDLKIEKVTDHDDNCYSYAFLKSILDNNVKEESKVHFYFFTFGTAPDLSTGIIVELDTDLYELYDYSNKPPRGGGGAFFIVLNDFFKTLIFPKVGI